MPRVRPEKSRINPDYFTQKQALAKVFSKLKKDFASETPTQTLISNEDPSASYDENVFTIVDTINAMTEQVSLLVDYYSGDVETDMGSILGEISKLKGLLSTYKTYFNLTFVKIVGSLSPEQRGQVKNALDNLNDTAGVWSSEVEDIFVSGEERDPISNSPNKHIAMRQTLELANVAQSTLQQITEEIKPALRMLQSTYNTEPANYNITGEDEETQWIGKREYIPQNNEYEASGHISGSTLYGGRRTGIHHPHNLLSPHYKHHYISSLTKRNI